MVPPQEAAYTRISARIRSLITKNVEMTAIGNSRRSLKDTAIDFVNASNLSPKDVALGSFLAPATVRKLIDGDTKRPQAETLERIFRFFENELVFKSVRLSAKNLNVAKKKA